MKTENLIRDVLQLRLLSHTTVSDCEPQERKLPINHIYKQGIEPWKPRTFNAGPIHLKKQSEKFGDPKRLTATSHVLF